jgi:hypothetical protein
VYVLIETCLLMLLFALSKSTSSATKPTVGTLLLQLSNLRLVEHLL